MRRAAVCHRRFPSHPLLNPNGIDTLHPDFWNQWVGLPFTRWGRGPGSFDCLGLVQAVLREGRGLTLPSLRTTNGETEEDWQYYRSGILAYFERDDAWTLLPLAQAQPFDVLLFHPHGTHVGIVVRRGKFLHITHQHTSSITRYTSPLYRDRIAGLYRHSSVTIPLPWSAIVE